ncbi:MAG: rRNA (cytidine1402-2-O)-methyltransferase [Actinomycetota bacterium]|nr:rRNA (cytidine1402-2-O)-methyltransferase [Actinomycetota bacterium]
MAGSLTLCATPIGNLEDTSARVLRVLEEADILACEDTRRTRKLLSHFGIRAKSLVTYNEGNERRKAAELVKEIAGGRKVVLVSDAGMPGLSDPGYRLVRASIEAGLAVDVVPGPNAAISALTVSGLPPGRFVFEGFLPRKAGERRRHIEALLHEPRTLVFYESPHRVVATLQDLAGVLGPRPASVVRELTKMHQEVLRDSLPALASQMEEQGPRGEIVLVVGGAVHESKPSIEPEDLAARARALMEGGMDRKAALSAVAKEAGVAKREVFDALVAEDKSAED